MQVIDDGDWSKDEYVAIIQFTTEICMKNKGGNIVKDEYIEFKHRERSTTQDGSYKMERWELFPLRNIHEWYEEKNNIKVHACGIRSFVYSMHWKEKSKECA